MMKLIVTFCNSGNVPKSTKYILQIKKSKQEQWEEYGWELHHEINQATYLLWFLLKFCYVFLHIALHNIHKVSSLLQHDLSQAYNTSIKVSNYDNG